MADNIRVFRIRVLIAVTTIVLLAGLLITFYSYSQTESIIKNNIETSLEIFTGRVLIEIEQLEVILETTIGIMNDEHIAIAKAVDYILQGASEAELSPQALQRLAEPLEIIELNIADSNGVLTHSNVPELIGFNYNDYDSTRIYIALATRTLTEIREEPRQSVLDDEQYGDINHYAGISRTGGGFIQLGFDASVIWRLYDEFNTEQVVRDIQIGESGFGIVVSNGVLTAYPDSTMIGVDVTDESWYKEINSGFGFIWLEIDGARYFAGYDNENNHTVVGLVPEAEYHKESRDLLSRALTLTFIAVAVIVPVTYMLTSGLVRDNPEFFKEKKAGSAEKSEEE